MILSVRTFERAMLIAGFLAMVSASAPGQSGGGGISGNVLLPNGAYLNERAKITLKTSRGVKSTVYTDDHGHFQFDRLTPDIYYIEVEPDGDRFELAKATSEVFSGASAFINITLKEKETAAKSAAKAISTEELDTKVPSKAKKEFEQAHEAVKSGNTNEAIGHLRKAIAIYPDYLMAHNDLGTQLLSQGKLDEAAAEFRRAIELGPKAFNPHLNLGIVLVEQRRFAQATEPLKVALTQDPNSPAANLYQGIASHGLNDFAGAERSLTAAHDLGGLPFALALYHLGQIYLDLGQREKARTTLEQYLREAPNAPQAADARKLVNVLR